VEVGAALARESPDTAVEDVGMLAGLELSMTADPHVWQRGVELATELKQHLFDTYYHAVALETPGCTLVTADERYFRVARAKGCIVGLTEWQLCSTRAKADSTPERCCSRVSPQRTRPGDDSELGQLAEHA
jgi:hypothetical protein